MELGIASPNEEKKMQMARYQAQVAPLAPPKKGMGQEMMDMAKDRAMGKALDYGQGEVMKGIGSLAGPSAAQTAGLKALAPAAGGLSPGASMAVMGNAGMAGTTGAQLAAGAGGAGMATLATAVPYVGAGLLAGKVLGLFNEGGMVGPLSAQYKAQGTMTPEQAKALMMNQPEPQAPPMVNPDQLYNEIVAESMTEAAQGQIPPTPTMRPPLMVDPLGADTTYSPYNMMRPDNVPST